MKAKWERGKAKFLLPVLAVFMAVFLFMASGSFHVAMAAEAGPSLQEGAASEVQQGVGYDKSAPAAMPERDNALAGAQGKQAAVSSTGQVLWEPASNGNSWETVDAGITLDGTKVPLGSFGERGGWALLNFAATVLTTVLMLASMAAAFLRDSSTKLVLLAVGSMVMLVSLLALLFTSNFSGQIFLINYASPLMFLLIAVQVVVLGIALHKRKNSGQQI